MLLRGTQHAVNSPWAFVRAGKKGEATKAPTIRKRLGFSKSET